MTIDSKDVGAHCNITTKREMEKNEGGNVRDE